MRHIKRGRGPAWMEALSGIVFLVIVLAMCSRMNGPSQGPFANLHIQGGTFGMGGGSGVFSMIPLVFAGMVVLVIANVAYNIFNATADNRTSELDIVDSDEEPDPLDPSHRNEVRLAGREESAGAAGRLFCPYCGARVGEEFKFCPKCGKQLAEN